MNFVKKLEIIKKGDYSEEYKTLANQLLKAAIQISNITLKQDQLERQVRQFAKKAKELTNKIFEKAQVDGYFISTIQEVILNIKGIYGLIEITLKESTQAEKEIVPKLKNIEIQMNRWIAENSQ